MPTRRANAANSIANALFGNTNLIAQNRGFNQQARGNANIASALLNTRKADDIVLRSDQRQRGLDLIEQEGDNRLLGDILVSDKVDPQQLGKRRLSGQKFDTNEQALSAILTGDLALANQLNQVGSDKPIEQFKTGSFGAFDITSGDLRNPELLASETNLNNAKTDKEIADVDKVDTEIDKLNVEIDALTRNRGFKPATGSAMLNYAAKLETVMSDGTKGGRDVIATDPETKKGKRWRDLTREEKDEYILQRILVFSNSDREQQLEELRQLGGPDPKNIIGGGEKEAPKEDAGQSWYSRLFSQGKKFFGDLLTGEDEAPPAQAPPAPAQQPTPVPALQPQSPVAGEAPLAESLGPQVPIPVDTNPAAQLNLAPTTPEAPPSIAAPLGAQVPQQATAPQVQQPRVSPRSALDFISDKLGDVFSEKPQVDPKLIERFTQVTSKSLRDRIFDLLSMKKAGDPRNEQIDATIRAMEEELRRRGDL